MIRHLFGPLLLAIAICSPVGADASSSAGPNILCVGPTADGPWTMCGPHAINVPAAPLGQIIGWKNFAGAKEDFVLPATPGAYTKTLTNMPPDPTFQKKLDASRLWCFVMLDVSPGDEKAVHMELIVLHGSKQIGNVVQGMVSTAPPGPHTTNTITFSFGYVFNNTVQPAGEYEVKITMASAIGTSGTFHSRFANLQCFEMLLPKSQ